MTSVIKVLAVILVWSQGGACETAVVQLDTFKTVRLGDTVDIKCRIFGKMGTRVWYKLSSSRRLQLLTSTDSVNKTSIYDKRYLIFSFKTAYTLRISDTRWEDAGTYYCGVLSLENVNFGRGTVLEIEGESKPIQSVLQRPGYIEAKPGDSVTLSCSFTSSHCPQEHTSVNWVRSGSASRIVSWNPGSSTVACETGDNPGGTSCVHNLTLEDISSPEDGTYVCVVIVCGDTRFGSGSRIELNEIVLPHQNPIIIALTAVSAAFTVSVLVLVGVICKMYKKPTKEMDRRHQGSPQDDQAEDGVTYARVNIRPRGAPCRTNFEQKRQDTAVYSEVRNR